MDRVRANREVYDLIRDGYRAEWQDDVESRQYATVQLRRLPRLRRTNDWLAASQVWVAGDLHRRRADTVLFVNGIPLVLVEFKEPNRPVKAAYDENLTDYRDTIPQLFVPNGFVLLSNGSRGQGRLDLRAVGVLRRLEGDRRRRHPGRRRAGDGDPRHLRAGPAARSDRELRRVHRAARRADQGRRPQPPVARRQRRDREPATGSGRRATSGSGCSGTPRAPASRLSMLWFTQKVLRQHPGRVDVRDGHRPHRAGRAAPRRVRRRRRDLARGEGARLVRRDTCASCWLPTTATCSR